VPANWNPAAVPGDAAWVADLVRRVTALEDEVRELRQAPATYLQQGTVSAYVAGPTCDVTWDDGSTSIVEKPATYVPAVGDKVIVGISPFVDPPKILTRVA
jgi:hypothetical protein